MHEKYKGFKFAEFELVCVKCFVWFYATFLLVQHIINLINHLY